MEHTEALFSKVEEQPPKLDEKTAKILPWLIATAFFMQMLDATILNTALPAIAESLNESPLHMHYVVIAYTLTVALLIPSSGWVADTFGTRRVFFAAILVFTLGSLFCATAPNLTTLVVARIVQGLGGALMVPVGRLIVLKAYPRAQLLQVLSFVTVPGLLGPLLGPVLGGILVQFASWHWIFIINLPVGLLGCWAILRWVPDIYGADKTPFDLKGFILFSTSMLMFSSSIEGLGELNLRHELVTLLLFLGLILMVAYWLLAAKHKNPLFSPKLFKTTTYAVGIAGNMFSRLASGALPFLTPLFLQVGFGFKPVVSGLSLVPLALAAIFSKYMVRRLVPAFGYRNLLLGNTILLGSAIMALSQISHSTPYIMILLLLTCLGALNSIQFTAMNTMTLLDLPQNQASSGNAMLSVVMQIAVSMGVAMSAALLAGFSTRYSSLGNEGIVLAFSKTYICVGLVSIMSAFIFLQAPKNAGKGELKHKAR